MSALWEIYSFLIIASAFSALRFEIDTKRAGGKIS
jgi:hypothetical protein